VGIVHRPGRIVRGEILLHPRFGDESGDASVIDIAKLRPNGREIQEIRGREISIIFQEPMTSLSPMYTVGQQIVEAILAHNRRIPKEEARSRAVELLGKVGIPKPGRLVDEYPFRLSGGMRQRSMIAMMLSCNPAMLIADEPTTALDVTTQAQILELMLELQQEYRMALLFITHDLGIVAEIADLVAVMYLGNIVEYGDVDTIFNNPRHPYTKALMQSIPKVSARREPLTVIKGMVPSPYRRPTGCPFHPRCASATPVCSQRYPPTMALSENHQVRCFLQNQTVKRSAKE